jgi:hypothetical protein
VAGVNRLAKSLASPGRRKSLNTVYLRTLTRAAEILGGEEKLRDYLHVPMHRLEAWLAGERPPMDVFLRAVDLVSASGTQIFGRSFALADPREVLEAALEAAIDATHANRGNVQLARRAHRAAHRRLAGSRYSARPLNDFFGKDEGSTPSSERTLIAAIGVPLRSFASAKGWMPQVGQK